MKRTGSMLKPSLVNADILEGLLESLHAARKRWRKLDRQGIRVVLRDLQKRRKDIIRQEDQYPPNDPLRLAFQCERAVADLHILELKKVSTEKRVKLPKLW